jgi:curved DNA-binding protein CbpA
MTDRPNHYRTLDTPVDSTTEEIEEAYREAVKRTHPDAGGTAEAFHGVQSAALVLRDSARRRRYDDGERDAPGPDDSRRAALVLLEQYVWNVLGTWINADFPPDKDPRRIDLMRMFADKMMVDIAGVRANVTKIERALMFLADVRGRFRRTREGANFLDRALADREDSLRKSLEDNRRGLSERQAALDMAAEYEFSVDCANPFDETRLVIPNYVTYTGE